MSKGGSMCHGEIDPVAVSYVLEASSPGINRPLRKLAHFAEQLGKS